MLRVQLVVRQPRRLRHTVYEFNLAEKDAVRIVTAVTGISPDFDSVRNVSGCHIELERVRVETGMVGVLTKLLFGKGTAVRLRLLMLSIGMNYFLWLDLLCTSSRRPGCDKNRSRKYP